MRTAETDAFLSDLLSVDLTTYEPKGLSQAEQQVGEFARQAGQDVLDAAKRGASILSNDALTGASVVLDTYAKTGRAAEDVGLAVLDVGGAVGMEGVTAEMEGEGVVADLAGAHAIGDRFRTLAGDAQNTTGALINDAGVNFGNAGADLTGDETQPTLVSPNQDGPFLPGRSGQYNPMKDGGNEDSGSTANAATNAANAPTAGAAFDSSGNDEAPDAYVPTAGAAFAASSGEDDQ